MDIHGYTASILVNGRKVKEYRHNGQTYVEAKDGTEFSIELKNHLSSRILGIISIDGIDVVDGKPATDKSRGYIVKGYNAETINGWRKSDTEVGAFKFVTKDKSYATGMGKGENNGIIAIKLIAEKYTPPTYAKSIGNGWPQPSFPKFGRRRVVYNSEALFAGPTPLTSGVMPMRSASPSASEPVASANYMASAYSAQTTDLVEEKAAEFDMGTTWGSKREDKVTTTEFEYGQTLNTFEFYYASREALKAMGVPLINERQVPRLPQAFETTYAQPPKDWKA